jgi:uncharacterized Zn-binding protein involved in type VI secretion
MTSNTIKAILSCDSYRKKSILEMDEEERINLLTKSEDDGGYGLSTEAASKISDDLKSWRVFDQYSNPVNGYDGRAFVKENEGSTWEVIISHQGTKTPQDFIADAGLGFYHTKGGLYPEMLSALEKLPGGGKYAKSINTAVEFFDGQMNGANSFSNRVYRQLQDAGQFNCRIEHVGHSLGGALSQIQAVKDDVFSQSLDSPGTKVVLDELLNSGDITKSQYVNSVNRVFNYGSTDEAFDFKTRKKINRGKIDKLQKLAFKFTEPYGKSLYLDDVHKHDCSGFVKYFANKEYRSKEKVTIFAARVGDTHTCPAYNGDTPHKGGPIADGSSDVLINGKRAARSTDPLRCDGVNQTTDRIIGGSESVLINGKPAARSGEKTVHGGVIIDFGSTDVLIGD